MISSAFWEKSAQVNFSKNFRCWFIPNCTRKMMWSLVNNIHVKMSLAFPFYASPLVTAPCSRLEMTTSTKIGQNFDGWMLMVKTQQVEICLSKTETFCHFAFLTLHVFLLPLRKEMHLLKKIPLYSCVFVYLGFGWAKRRNCCFIDGCFSKNFHARYYSRVKEKTKSVSNLSHLLAFRSCISDELELLHFFCRVSYGDLLDKFVTMYGLVFKIHWSFFETVFWL